MNPNPSDTPSGSEGLGTTCVCGHPRSAHIYEEGACRPGYVCPSGCINWTPEPSPGTDHPFPPPIITKWLRHQGVPTDALVQELDYWARHMAGDSAGPHYVPEPSPGTEAIDHQALSNGMCKCGKSWDKCPPALEQAKRVFDPAEGLEPPPLTPEVTPPELLADLDTVRRHVENSVWANKPLCRGLIAQVEKLQRERDELRSQVKDLVRMAEEDFAEMEADEAELKESRDAWKRRHDEAAEKIELLEQLLIHAAVCLQEMGLVKSANSLLERTAEIMG